MMSLRVKSSVFLKAIGLVLLMLIALCGGCEKHKKPYKIGVSQCSSDDWRAKMNSEIEREIMYNEDAEVEIRSADDDNSRQIADIRYFADHGFDIIIVAPNEAEALTPAIREIYERGIPVIIFDRNINGDTYTARIGVDDRGLGASAARYALNMLSTGKAIEITGRPGSTPANDRHSGFADQFIAGGGEIIAAGTGNWNQSEAVGVADSLIRNFPEADIIFAHNDRMAIGASETARRLGRDDIRIIGIDAAPQIGIKAVADSVIDATFLYPTDGYRLVRTALNILRGEPYDRETIIPVSSAVDISNADILLRQNETISQETGRMKELKMRIDDYWRQHSSQTLLFYASIAIIVLLIITLFLMLRGYWSHRRHQQALASRNALLQEERDKQKDLNRQLEEATQSKLTFFTNVSHDLRTPLSLIAEPVAQLVDAPNLTPRQHTLISLADKNVRILHRLINQILDFRKYENGKLSLHLTEIDLSRHIAEWMESFRSLARKHDMKLEFREPENPVVLAVDVEKIERVFFNLLSNAFKYTPDNGTITVSCRATDTEAIISVADTGMGISSRDLGNIFDRFYQAEKVHPNGSGIGLSLCKAFVELHEGNITVESALKKGSEFTVTLPLRHVAGEAAPVAVTVTEADVEAELHMESADAEFEEGRPLVLVIDDNTDIRLMLRELLAADYNVIEAADGSTGLRKAIKYVPDLIICDVMMPGMDGMECCRRLKSETLTSHIPVLMLTACSRDEERVTGYESGADGYLSKPFSAGVLLARCASLIANRRLIKQLWAKGDAPAAHAAPESASATSEAQPARPTPPAGDIDNEFYARFLEIFTPDMGNPDLSVETLASRMGLERTQFYRKIKAITNYSPVELVRNLRLKQGRHMLKTTDRSISEIAYATGFSTPAYFTKCYRTAYGETPSETRSAIGK